MNIVSLFQKHFFPSVFLKNFHFFSGKDSPCEATHPESTEKVLTLQKYRELSTTIDYSPYDIEFLTWTPTELLSSLMVFVKSS